MDSIVNDKYKYIMFYSAKAGCTSMRNLFIALHKDEMSEQQRGQMNSYHNINELFPYDRDADYSDYYKFYISRNPYSRVVSGFLDQYVYAQNTRVKEMLEQSPPKDGPPQTFIEFLEYLKTVKDSDRDGHFQTQAFSSHVVKVRMGRSFLVRYYYKDKSCIPLNYAGDIAGFNSHMQKVYRKIFKRDPQMREKAMREIGNIQKMNSSFYGPETHENAATLTVAELDDLVYAPKPQDFFLDESARQLVQEIYAEDFYVFGYDKSKIPQKKASRELAAIPDDFDWETYLMLAPDLQLAGINKERTVMRHFLEFGQHEIHHRAYKVEAPDGFDWREYLAAHEDLTAAGIDNERDAIIHYLSYGRNEGRELRCE
ncbi:MAG: sulfotransferase family 2 domain-containing protein [Pseudomonadota bacterium]